MAPQGPLREVLTDVREELWRRRAQVSAFVTYVVLGAGGLYLFSALGEDSGEAYDVTRRTTLAAVGVGLLALGVLLGVATLLLDRHVRRHARPGAPPGHVEGRRPLVAAMCAGTLLGVAGLVALL